MTNKCANRFGLRPSPKNSTKVAVGETFRAIKLHICVDKAR